MSDPKFFLCDRPESDQPFRVVVQPGEEATWEALSRELRTVKSWSVEPSGPYPVKKCYTVSEVSRGDL